MLQPADRGCTVGITTATGLTALSLGSLTLDPEFSSATTEYETETANASDTLTVTPEGTYTTVEVRFYEAAPDDPDDPQPSEYSVIEPSEGEYTLTWDFTGSDENLIQIVATSEAVEASTWVTVAKTTPVGPQLATLSLTGLASLTPAFDPDTLSYTAASDGTGGTITFSATGISVGTEYTDAVLFPGASSGYNFTDLDDMYAYMEEHSINSLAMASTPDDEWVATVPSLEAGAYSIVLVAADVTMGDDDWTVHAHTDYWIDLTVT